MSEISERIIQILREFGSELLDGHFTSAGSHHHPPLPIIRPFGAEMLEDTGAIAADLADFWQHWAAVGVTGLTPTIIGLRSFAYGVYLADIEWSFRDDNGAEVALVHTSYGFREAGGRLGISSIFCHDEFFQRPLSGANA